MFIATCGWWLCIGPCRCILCNLSFWYKNDRSTASPPSPPTLPGWGRLNSHQSHGRVCVSLRLKSKTPNNQVQMPGTTCLRLPFPWQLWAHRAGGGSWEGARSEEQGNVPHESPWGSLRQGLPGCDVGTCVSGDPVWQDQPGRLVLRAQGTLLRTELLALRVWVPEREPGWGSFPPSILCRQCRRTGRCVGARVCMRFGCR